MRSAEAAADRNELTRERILEAAENLLRRHGLAKTTVVDVARALDMSHANVYRHFDSKAALLDALVERWLTTVSRPLAAIVERRAPAAERLEAWVLKLVALKRRKVLDDPELFATYHAAAQATRKVVETHRAGYYSDLTRIIREGVAAGEFEVADAEAAAAALLDAARVFVDPHHIVSTTEQRTDKEIERDARRVVRLIVGGLKAGVL